MPGGLINIIAYGASNTILTGNPSKTFFKAVYKKYSNFEYIFKHYIFLGNETPKIFIPF